MYTDLFAALLNRENRRGHPILSALLYSFCPAAARWWIEGADPQPPFDPVWQAIKDWNSETSLTEQLGRYGLGQVVDVVRNYVEEIDQFRRNHDHALPSPELSPSFKGGHFPNHRRFASENGINNMGGKWHNLFVYARTWAFLLDDWRKSMFIDKGANYNLRMETVSLTLPDFRSPVHFETLVWRVQIGHVTEARIGLLVQRGELDLLRFALLGLSSPHGDHPWPNLPLVYALDRETGEAKLADQPVSNRELPKLVRQLAKAAQEGPYLPLTALQYPSDCKNCGYQHLCYRNSNLAPHLLADK
jgi:hypothetical protein